MKNILSMSQLSNEEIFDLIHLAMDYKSGRIKSNNSDKFAMNLFFEDSTRTNTSFQVAEAKLGMKQIDFDARHSSVNKGESLYDTVKTVESMGVNLAVIRHKQDKFYEELLGKGLKIHLINAGDGTGQHPSQSLLDLMTIYERFGYFEGLKVGIIGDLKHSRVAHSDAQALTNLGAEVNFGGLDGWYSDEFKAIGPHMEVDELCQEMDIVMLLRVQHERLADNENQNFSKEEYFKEFGIDMRRVEMMKADTMIMHPAPINRGVEIADDIVECEKSYIFKQMENGVYMRMAMIESLLGGKQFDNDPDQEREFVLR
ncbi:aspartate carbamoyltransferase catalytic subunit [Companilactobacillus keshanensis]|uniref:Aspartate carbamoyltransferase n=1 Tax=Companilactobacillus keshanensis TaxID=2486003 RepID=A0ABW4BUI9_9LACO|nr:aspartate carbamoyltransferase catalytic subunit [Companilactobacillus keshanensis]